MKHRYRAKRHRGPTHRGFKPTIFAMEGNIPVIVAEKGSHIRGFYLHPTKGWRSTGPEGRR